MSCSRCASRRRVMLGMLSALFAGVTNRAWGRAANMPVPGTEDYELMMPFADWIATRRTNPPQNWLCCSISDAAPCKSRYVQGNDGSWHFEVDFGRSAARIGAPSGWIPVADSQVVRNENPTGIEIAWYLSNDYEGGGMVRCFFPGDAG